MRTISFLVQSVFLIIYQTFLFACSDPLFWVVSREQHISKNNLPKDSQATGVIFFRGYYYATVGVSLWRRAVDGVKWFQVTLPVKNVLGVGCESRKIYLGTYEGIYQSSDGLSYTKIQNSQNPTFVYAYTDNTEVTRCYFVSTGDNFGQYAVYTLDRTSLQLTYKINGTFTGSGRLGVSSNNAIFSDTSLQARSVFEWISGYNNNYLYADGFIGTYNGTNWIKKVKSGHPANRGSTVFEYSIYNTKALYSVYELGYFEIYEQEGRLKIRVPTETVESKESYQVSNLAFTTITRFYQAPNNDLFALTSRKGLWRNTEGVWFQE